MIKQLLLAGLVLAPLAVFAQTFSIDNGHSSVLTSVQRFGMVDVVGRFMDVSGTLVYDEDPAGMSCSLVIKTDSYSSNNPGGEGAVKSPAFLDAGQFPELRFESSGVRAEDNMLIATGALTIHGTTREVSFPILVLPPFKDPTGVNTVAVSAEITINRQDYGVSFDRKMGNGNSLVANEVQIRIDLLAAQQ